MARDRRAYIWDILTAAEEITTFTERKSLPDYLQDPLLRAAVERKFEIIGEALSKLLQHFPQDAMRIDDHQQIIAFLNRLIHGYSTINDLLVWDVLQTHLPNLRKQVLELLESAAE